MGTELWCRACGTGPVAGPRLCSSCGTDLGVATAGDLRIGQVVMLPGRLLSRNGIVIGTSGDSLSMLGKGDRSTAVPAADFARLQPVAVPGLPVIGEAGRLWAASLAVGAGVLKGSWPDVRLKTVADQLATQDLPARRAAAVDAIALGRHFWLPQAGLTESELSWYQARHAALRGDLTQMIAWLARLPADRYRARVSLLLARAGGLLADPGLAVQAAAQLGPFEQTAPDARALRRALNPIVADDLPMVAVEYATVLVGSWGTAAAPAAALAEAIRDRRRVPVPPAAGPLVRGLDAYLADRAGAGTVEPAALTGLPRALLDDLVDAGTLMNVAPDAGFAPDVRAYLRCRLHPGRVSAAELTAAGFVAEQARRFYLARDADGLSGLDSGDPTVRHFRALLAFVRDNDRQHLDDLWPATRVLADLAGTTGDVPEPLAADRSAWPLLRDAVIQGRLTAGEEVRAAHPDFAVWSDVCELTRLIYDNDWAGAVRRAPAVLRAAPGGPLADEVANLTAYAKWQLGDPDGALVTLDAGAGTALRTGMVLNASVIATTRGSAAALPPLARLAREAPDPRVRNDALLRAVHQWLTDDAVTGYPPELAGLVRGRLAEPIDDDDFFRTLVVFSANSAAAWLADATVHTANPVQAETAGYFRTRCRVLDESRPETLTQLGHALVAVWHREPRPEWVVRERDRLADRLMDLVHRRFGEAAGLTGVIVVLADGGALEPFERLVLSAQAGAHLAMSLGDDEDLPPAAEQKLLLEPAYHYLRSQQELPEQQRAAAAADLARCLSVAALAVPRRQSDRAEQVGSEYNELVERRQWDRVNDRALAARQLHLLDVLQAVADRLRSYQVVLARFTVPDDLGEIPEMVRAEADSLTEQVDLLRRGF